MEVPPLNAAAQTCESYEALRRDFEDDPELLDSFEASVSRVRSRFDAHYPGRAAPLPVVGLRLRGVFVVASSFAAEAQLYSAVPAGETTGN